MFLLASAALHAAALMALPALVHEPERTRSGALEVTILEPEPLPVAAESQRAPAPARPRGMQRRGEPERTAAWAPRWPGLPRRVDASPALVLPEQQPEAPSEPAPPAGAARGVPAGAGGEPAAAEPPGSGAGYLLNPAPVYPLAARRAGEQGTVTLRVLVTAEGLPARVEIEKSSGSIHLDTAAAAAVRAWRFRPARRGAVPIESWHLVPIIFRLVGSS